MKVADELRRMAAKIDTFPKYIRRDVGQEGLRSKVIRELAELGHKDDDRLVDYIVDLSNDLRKTVSNYYAGQFDNDG